MHPNKVDHRRRRQASRSNRWRAPVLRWLVLIFCLLLLLTAGPVLLLKYVDPVTSSFMLRARWQAWRADRDTYQTRFVWLDWEKMSPHAALAVIAAEDQLFPVHSGFDVKAIRKAWKDNQRGKRMRGASTISQQVAKNLFLWSGRSFVRKGLEAWFTTLIELTWSKQRTLEVYLNIAQFGDGVYGVPAAATFLLHKAPATLTERDAALLAAVLPNPIVFRVDQPSNYVLGRRAWIVRQMQQLGGVDYLQALAQ